MFYFYDVAASDADNDVQTFALLSAPVGMNIDAPTGAISWTPTPDQLGPQEFQVRVTGGNGGESAHSVTQSWQIQVVEAAVPLVAIILIEPATANLGDAVLITVIPQGFAGPVSLNVTLDGIAVALDPHGQATVSADQIGVHTLTVVLTDPFESTTVNSTYFVLDPADSLAPVVSINNLSNDQVVTAPVDVRISVSDDNLHQWVVGYVGKGIHNGQFIPLASGSTAVMDATVARFDPTGLTNGQYALLVQATDNSGNQATDSVNLRVAGDLKVGNFTITFEDLSIPLSGIPITVNRTYDSRRRNEDLDFGFGWSID